MLKMQFLFNLGVPTRHEKKKGRNFFSIPKKELLMTVMKDTYPKRKFKPNWMGLLENPDFQIHPEIWHLCRVTKINEKSGLTLLSDRLKLLQSECSEDVKQALLYCLVYCYSIMVLVSFVPYCTQFTHNSSSKGNATCKRRVNTGLY